MKNFRFVPLSSQKIGEVPASSPLHKCTLVTKESSDPTKLRTHANFFLAGLLRVYQQAASSVVCVRQEAVFLSRNLIGLYVPADCDVLNYSGICLKTSAQNSHDKSTMVEFFSFDAKYVSMASLDLVKNLISLLNDASSSLPQLGTYIKYVIAN